MFVLREANMHGVLDFSFQIDVLYLTYHFKIAKEITQ